jgi:4-hydroxybenzoate polyprenyltransferase
LLAFTTFLFLSLAIVKRVAELQDLRARRQGEVRRRRYQASDLEVLSVIGACAGQIAVLVLALYIQSENVMKLYPHPNVLWLLCIAMFYWITRIWLKLHRGEMRQDPVVYALKDGASYAVGAAALLIVFAASR